MTKEAPDLVEAKTTLDGKLYRVTWRSGGDPSPDLADVDRWTHNRRGVHHWLHWVSVKHQPTIERVISAVKAQTGRKAG